MKPVICPPPTLAVKAQAPSLTIDLAEPILALAVHLAAASSLWSPSAIAQPLNVLPHAVAPLVTKAALIQLPHVNLDLASKVGNIDLLRFMLKWSKQPGGRPVHYDGHIGLLMKQGNLDVLNWWMHDSGLVLEWNIDGFAPVFEQGHLHVLEWWRELGFPHLDEVDLDWCFAKASSVKNGACVLDWCFDYLPADAFKSAVEQMAKRGRFFVSSADDANLNLQVMQWWLAKAQQVDWIDSSGVLTDAVYCAFQENDLAVLEWCKHHIQGIDLVPAGTRVLELAVKGPHFAWIDKLHIDVSEAKYHEPATMAACHAGNVDALIWLKSKGYFTGSWTKMMVRVIQSEEASPEAMWEVLEWIHSQLRGSEDVKAVAIREDDQDPYLAACRYGRVDVLDWLHANDYQMSALAKDLDKYFDAASNGHVPALDWVYSHVDSHDVDLRDIAFMSALATASRANSIAALDWWWEKLTVAGVENLTRSEYADDDGKIDVSAMVHSPCHDGAIDIVQWWIEKNQAGSMQGQLFFDDAYLNVCFVRHPDNSYPQPNCVAILRMFLDARVEMDFSSCIYLASTNGKLDVLDWLLNEAKAPLEAFLDAFNPADECKYYQVVLDCMAHQKTHDGSALLWWRHNVPQVQGTWMTPSPANEQYNPINMHLLEQVLKVQDILWPSAMWNLRGSWSMLSYLQNKGILTASGLAEEQDKDWSLEDELICISARTPPSWLCTALEWWQCAFPQQFACPAEIASGETPVREGARKWWLRSGLCAADSGITSFDRR